MNNNKKYTAQDIEIITGINRKQIYEYDLLGIVEPVEVNKKNHYKYYDEDAVTKFSLISLLVELGYTPKVLQNKFKDKYFNIDKELDGVLENADQKIKQLEEVKRTAKELKSTKNLLNNIRNDKSGILNFDYIVPKIAVLGVPGLILMIAIGATGLAGAAALTTALAALGPFGMIGGIATLGLAGLISEMITKVGFDSIFEAVVTELYRKGETRKSLNSKIDGYPVSKELKIKLKEKLDNIKEK